MSARAPAVEAWPLACPLGWPRRQSDRAANHWRELGLEPGATPGAIRERYRALARQRHPDAGGSAAEYAALTAARDAALAEVGGGA